LAKYKTLPNYELHRPELHVQFNSEGIYVTNDHFEIDYLDGCAPFIDRLDKAEEKPKAPAKPKK
jgi:hypothetical protein